MATQTNTSIFIPLEGVESEHCALIVDNGLAKVPGITAHKVKINNKRAIIGTMASVNGKNVYTWIKKGEVVVMRPGKDFLMLGKGMVPVINAINDEKVICVWENEKQIHASVIEL